MEKKTHMAVEDYLETILMLKEKNQTVRSIDIAEHLDVKKPSVTYATQKLKDLNHILMDENGFITLTESGFAIADRILKRHHLLTQFFMALGVDEATAAEDACKVEHDLSEVTFDAICKHAEKYGK